MNKRKRKIEHLYSLLNLVNDNIKNEENTGLCILFHTIINNETKYCFNYFSKWFNNILPMKQYDIHGNKTIIKDTNYSFSNSIYDDSFVFYDERKQWILKQIKKYDSWWYKLYYTFKKIFKE